MKANERKIVGFLYFLKSVFKTRSRRRSWPMQCAKIRSHIRAPSNCTVQYSTANNFCSLHTVPRWAISERKITMTSTRLWRPEVLVKKTRVWVGLSVSWNHKTWSQWFLLRDFLFKITQISVSKRGSVQSISYKDDFFYSHAKSSLRPQTGLICTQPWKRRFLEHCQCDDFGFINVLFF